MNICQCVNPQYASSSVLILTAKKLFDCKTVLILVIAVSYKTKVKFNKRGGCMCKTYCLLKIPVVV